MLTEIGRGWMLQTICLQQNPNPPPASEAQDDWTKDRNSFRFVAYCQNGLVADFFYGKQTFVTLRHIGRFGLSAAV